MNPLLATLAQQFLSNPAMSDMRNSLIQIAIQVIQSQPGGLTGFVQKMAETGLQQQVQSWVGTGQNQPVSTDQMQKALGMESIAKLAQQFGMPSTDLLGGLTKALPMLVDGLTPKGTLPQESAVADILGALQGKIGVTTQDIAPISPTAASA